MLWVTGPAGYKLVDMSGGRGKRYVVGAFLPNYYTPIVVSCAELFLDKGRLFVSVMRRGEVVGVGE